MAAKDGATPEHLSFAAQASPQARRYGLFPLLRGLEARARDRGLPRIGASRLPEQNVADLVQVPTLTFPGATLESIALRRDRPEVEGYWLGLTGPMGPLPIHLTELASYERRYGKARPFGRFLDLLAGRMLQFFYRAWAESQPAAQADRPDEDAFARYVAVLSGSQEGVRSGALFSRLGRLHYAAVFASRRSAVSIEDALSHLLGLTVRLLPFRPSLRDIEPGDRTRLGAIFNSLGGDAVAGGRVYGVSDSFRVVLRAATFREYEDFLPTGRRFMIAAEALDAFAPSHLQWDIELELDEREARPTRLDGRARLGWTSWAAPKGRALIRSDTRLGRGARRIARARLGGLGQ
jgi:type VI secretion system ImpH/TssG family protein